MFYIVSGEFDILLGDETVRARAGDVLNAPTQRAAHVSRAGDGPSTLLFLTYPAGVEEFFAEAAELGFPPDLQRLAAADAERGV